MKYEKPIFEIEMIEVSDVIAASNGNAEIVFAGEGKGDVIFNASGIFGTR